MVARISTFSQHQLMLANTLRNQSRVATAQEQIASGKKAGEYRELSPDVARAAAARESFAQIESFKSTVDRVSGRVDVYDRALSTVADTARDLRRTILDALGQNDAAALNVNVESAFETVAGTLNTVFDGQYIFAGANTDRPPMTVTDIAGLQALATPADAFANDAIKAQARVEESVTLDYGVLADETAGDLVAAIRRIADFNTGPDGPFDGELTQVQRDYLQTELFNLEQAIDAAHGVQIDNGLNARRLEDLAVRHADQAVFLETLIGGIEDVDMAEAISRLNRDQTALEASYQAFATLNRMSLLNFL